MNNSIISDNRKKKNFTKNTISGYLKKDVLKNLQNTIQKSELEQACYWTAELISSGFIWELMLELIFISCKYINVMNNFLPKYIFIETDFLLKIIQLQKKSKILELRNKQEIRNHFCEFVALLCLSKKSILSNVAPQAQYQP